MDNYIFMHISLTFFQLGQKKNLHCDVNLDCDVDLHRNVDKKRSGICT